MKRLLLFAALALFVSTAPSFAGKKTDDYKLKKAYEVLKEKQDEEQALKLLGEQLETTPDNVEALLLRVKIHRNREEFGDALSDINRAIKVNRPKVSEIPMSTLYWWKGSIYGDMNEDKAEAEMLKTALSMARKDDKENVQSIAFDYAQVLFDLKLLDESDAVYNSMLKEDEADQAAMVGLARNMRERGRYQECVDLCEKAMKYDADYASQYNFAMQAYDKMGNIDKAIDNGLLLVEKDTDAITEAVITIFLKHKNYALAKIREKEQSSQEKAAWSFVRLCIYEQSFEYEKAIGEYDALEAEYGKDENIYLHRASCYEELGLTNSAISEFKAAIDLNDDAYNNSSLGDCYRGAGMYKEAIETYSRVVDMLPSNAYGYYARGWCHELMGDDEKAMEDYEYGIDVDKTYPYIFLMRGQLFLKHGQKDKADADFETVLQLDTAITDGSCRHYALHFLGRDDEAQEWMEKIKKDSPEDRGNWYDQACLFSRMGRLDEAVKALEKSLELGYCKFAHIAHDDDLDAIRDREDFKSMVKNYSDKLEKRIEDLRKKVGEPKEELLTEVSIKRHTGGTFEIPCKVNGLDLNMLFDTGASDVTISSVEANFMLKNDYLSKDDVKGKKYYQIANGDLTEGTVITLKEVKVGDAVLKNVDASVVTSQKAPLLLGQSVMERFGTITIDNINSKLIIKQ